MHEMDLGGQAGAMQYSSQTYLSAFQEDWPTFNNRTIEHTDVYIPADWKTNSKQNRQAALGSAPSPPILVRGRGGHHVFLHTDQGVQQALTQTSACRSLITWLPARHREDQTKALWHSHMLDLRDVLQAEALMVSHSCVCGGNQVTVECIWIEDSWCWTTLYIIEDK